MLTIGYVRVSTEDQVDYSPDAQRKRCLQHAISNDLGSITFLADEGLSGKDLNRPGVQELIRLIEADEVAHVIVWRLDRLSRDQADLSRLVKLFERHCVELHSVNEGRVDVNSASGRMQAGIHGVLAQYYREGLVENVKMGNHQAIAEKGRWLNRPPSGYDLVNGELVPNELASLIPRLFELRAEGLSYPDIERRTGVKYSTVRQIVHNRAYLGETRLRDQWYPGIHRALVTAELFEAAQRGNSTGKRLGRDLLSGRVVCGTCGKRVPIESSGHARAIYRCKHRGHSCGMPGRMADGLLRAVVVAMRELAHDTSLQDAIRHELAGRSPGATAARPPRAGDLGQLRRKREKLLGLYYADKITPELFAEQERMLTRQIEQIEAIASENLKEAERRHRLANQFERVAEMLRTLDVDAIWEHANERERRTLITQAVQRVILQPDRLQVEIAGAPPLTVLLEEVGLRGPGIGNGVSEGGLEPPRT